MNDSFEKIAVDFLAQDKPIQDKYFAFYKEQANLGDVIENFALDTHKFGKFRLKSYINDSNRFDAKRWLLDISDRIQNCESFYELYCLLKTAFFGRSFGEFATYDAACWIGAYLDFSPLEVYRLPSMKTSLIAFGLDHRLPKYSPYAFPVDFHCLRADQIEYCIYRHHKRIVAIAKDSTEPT